MHYKGADFGYDVLAAVDEFLALFPSAQKMDSDEIDVTEAQGVMVPTFNH